MLNDELQRIRERIGEALAKTHNSVVNVVSTASPNELLRGVAALLGPCSLIRLEDEPLGTRSIETLSKAWKRDQPVVLGCRPSHELPLMLFNAYGDVRRNEPSLRKEMARFRGSSLILQRLNSGDFSSLDQSLDLRNLDFSLLDQSGELKDLVLLFLHKREDPTPEEFRTSFLYTLVGEYEAPLLAGAGREDDSAVERIGQF